MYRHTVIVPSYITAGLHMIMIDLRAQDHSVPAFTYHQRVANFAFFALSFFFCGVEQ